MDEENYFKAEGDGDDQGYYKPWADDAMPISNDTALGQWILKTFARCSDPPRLFVRKIKRRVPIIGTATVVDDKGKTKETNYIREWREETWESEPMLIQPKYHEHITDDMSRAFLSEGDLEVCRTSSGYCKAVKSFAERYGLDLSLHHNNMVDDMHYLIVSSGAFKGKRVQLAKTNIAETSYRANMMQQVSQEEKKKRGMLQNILNP